MSEDAALARAQEAYDAQIERVQNEGVEVTVDLWSAEDAADVAWKERDDR